MEKSYLHPTAVSMLHGPEAYWVRTDDGVRLRIAVAHAVDKSSGSVLIFPGRTDYIEQFSHSIGELQRRGFSSLVIDWRGHGLSDRVSRDPAIGHVARFSDYQKDVAAMIQAADNIGLPKPWYLLAHSMGGCIGLRAVLDGLPIAASAFTAPMWGISLSAVVRAIALPVTRLAVALGKGEMYAPGHSGDIKVLKVPFEQNTMTNDPERYSFLVDLAKEFPDAQTGGPSMGWLRQALLEMSALSKIASPNTPSITFIGQEETTVDVQAIRMRMEGWRNSSLVTLPAGKHELLMERPLTRNVVMDKICDLFRTVAQGT